LLHSFTRIQTSLQIMLVFSYSFDIFDITFDQSFTIILHRGEDVELTLIEDMLLQPHLYLHIRLLTWVLLWFSQATECSFHFVVIFYNDFKRIRRRIKHRLKIVSSCKIGMRHKPRYVQCSNFSCKINHFTNTKFDINTICIRFFFSFICSNNSYVWVAFYT